MEFVRPVPLFEAEAIAARVGDVAAVLDREERDTPMVVIAILKGAAFFLSDLVRRFSSAVSCEYMSVRRAEDAREILEIDFSTGFDVAGRPVLLLKDVVTTGVIETYLTGQLRAAGASAVRLAAIVDKPADRTTPVTVEFPLFTAESGVFVGYGMDHRGRFANLPYVAELPEAAAAARPEQ